MTQRLGTRSTLGVKIPFHLPCHEVTETHGSQVSRRAEQGAPWARTVSAFRLSTVERLAGARHKTWSPVVLHAYALAWALNSYHRTPGRTLAAGMEMRMRCEAGGGPPGLPTED